MRCIGNTKTNLRLHIAHFFVGLCIMCSAVLLVTNEIFAECYQEIISIDIPYGAEEGQLGFVDEEEVPKMGPSSFANDAEGNLYVCDTVNRRIQVYNQDGAYQRTVPLANHVTPIDIVVEDPNHLFVYDHSTRQLHQVAYDGKVVASTQFDPRTIPCLNSMHIVGENIYRRTCDENDMLVGMIQNERLIKATEDMQMRGANRGIVAPSQRRYALELLRGKKGAIYLHDDKNLLAGRKKLKDLDIERPISLKFLKEDKRGNFFLQTERLVGKKVVLEIRKFNAAGERLCVLPIHDTDYAAWPIKLLSVDSDGRIWQLVPGAESARLHVFSSSSE